jgi:hypothetical protein
MMMRFGLTTIITEAADKTMSTHENDETMNDLVMVIWAVATTSIFLRRIHRIVRLQHPDASV